MFKVEIKPVAIKFDKNGDAVKRCDTDGRPMRIVIEASTYVTVDEHGKRRRLSAGVM